ncbi:MAG: O-antigen ligase family protein [Paludibacteraceae bacterium]
MSRRITLTRIQIGEWVSYLPMVGLLALLGAMPFHYGEVQRIALYWIAATYPIDYIVNARWRGWKWTQSKWTYVAFIAFFCLIPIWQCFDPVRTSLYQFTIERYMPFLVVGICGLAGMTDKMRIEYASWVMLGVSAGIVVYLLTLAGLPDFAHFEVWTKQFNQLRAFQVNTHMTINLYFNLSLILGLYTILRSKYAWWVKVLTGVLMLPILFVFSFTEGRTGVLTFLGTVMITLMYYMFRMRRWWLSICIILFACGAALFLMQRERFQVAVTEVNPRIYIWNVAGEEIEAHPIWGQGVCSAREDFVERGLANEDFQIHYSNSLKCELKRLYGDANMSVMHPHNAVLETWTQFGIIGVLLLLACWILPLIMRLGREQLYVDLCVFAFFMQAMFESMGNNLPPMFLCLMVILIDYHHQYMIAKAS